METKNANLGSAGFVEAEGKTYVAVTDLKPGAVGPRRRGHAERDAYRAGDRGFLLHPDAWWASPAAWRRWPISSAC